MTSYPDLTEDLNHLTDMYETLSENIVHLKDQIEKLKQQQEIDHQLLNLTYKQINNHTKTNAGEQTK